MACLLDESRVYNLVVLTKMANKKERDSVLLIALAE